FQFSVFRLRNRGTAYNSLPLSGKGDRRPGFPEASLPSFGGSRREPVDEVTFPEGSEAVDEVSKNFFCKNRFFDI
ncbi:MAG: hypothetical protein KBS76_08085, partial [Ruminococcus sp.]|nr:hypothetical protein [Candidatus Apopatosoma intestinale]